ncbi:MAG TPA: hypothetical protein VND94_02100 [Terriglobia bacterium]|nr:hypothetical protein [Terriglobia bacterium]
MESGSQVNPCGGSACWTAPAQGKGKAFVDLQNDVTAKDIKIAHQEGYQSVESRRARRWGCGAKTHGRRSITAPS